jgi:hypothetical protein
MDIDGSKVEMLLQSIMREANYKREEELTVMLSTIWSPVSPQSENNNSFCGLSLEDRCLHEGTLREVMALNKKHESGQLSRTYYHVMK